MLNAEVRPNLFFWILKAPSDRHDAADAVEARPCLDGSGTAHGPTDEDVGRRGERGEHE